MELNRFIAIIIVIFIIDILIFLIIGYIDLSFEPSINTLFYDKTKDIPRFFIIIYHIFGILILNTNYNSSEYNNSRKK